MNTQFDMRKEHREQAADFLLTDLETGEDLHFDSPPKQEGEFFTFTVANKDRSRRYKYSLKTEEI